jgi:hypothetical protein
MKRAPALLAAGALALGTLALGACHSAAKTAPPVPTGSTQQPAPSTTTADPQQQALPDWPTFGGSSQRTGAAATPPGAPAQATGLSPAWSTSPLDGAVYAQPLLVGNLAIAATEGDSVYAFDRGSGVQVWRTQLGRPVDGGTLPCGNIDPTGITATPVADPAGHTVYALPFLANGPHHELVALDLATGTVRWQRPLDPPGLPPRAEQARAALTLANHRVYAAFGGLAGDCAAYKGAVVSVDAAGDGPVSAYVVPTSRQGGIWAPPGPMATAAGDLFVATGNTAASGGAFDGGNAVVRLGADLRQADVWGPADWAQLNQTDTDLGGVSPVPVGGRLFVAGKSGLGYLLDPARLGGVGARVPTARLCGQAIGGAASSNQSVLVACSDGMVGVSIVPGGDSLRASWHARATQPGPPTIAAGAGWWVDHSGTLHGTAVGDGRQVASVHVGDVTRFTSIAADGVRLYLAAGGRLLAFTIR